LAEERENLLEELYKKDQIINNLTNDIENMKEHKKNSEELRMRVILK
jgi:hypothetical protein